MTPHTLRITNGRVIDPANGVDAVRDVLVHDGRIVERLPDSATPRTIDAAGRLVLPGAIDLHTHVASRGVAIAHEADGDLVPTPADTALRYLRMGYTCIVDPAVPPEDVGHAHATLDAMPAIDTGFLLELGTHDELIHALAEHGERAGVEVVDSLIAQSGALGLKLVSPRHADGLDAALADTRITTRQLIRFAAAAAEALPTPHPLQLHVPELGAPGNVADTIAALEALEGHQAHLAHAQFYAYQRDDDGALCSGAAALCDYIADHPHITLDSGCITFGPAMMVTRDHPLADHLAALMQRHATVRDGWSVMPMHYEASHPVNAMQWAIGLELVLRSVDLSRITLSVDHPNGGPFTAMPRLLELLASRAARDAALQKTHSAAGERTGLAKLTRELTDAELVTLTRTAPARALNLPDRGHLAPGAVGDLVITDRPWHAPHTVVKSGVVVVEADGSRQQALALPPGNRLSVVQRATP